MRELKTCPACHAAISPTSAGKCPECGRILPETLTRAEKAERAALRQTSSPAARAAALSPVPDDPSAPMRCPRCGSTQIQAVKSGFGFRKAIAGAAIAGNPAGLLAGTIGADKLRRVCIRCGRKF